MLNNIQSRRLSLLIDGVCIIIGNALLSFAIITMIAPNNIAPGGASGVAIMINYLTKIPVGAANLMINIPLMLAAVFMVGKEFVIKTLLSIFTFSFCADYLYKDFVFNSDDILLNILFAGVIGGVGSAILFLRNGSSGGSDIVAIIVKKFKPHFKTGKLVLIVDLFVIGASVIVFKNINTAMYAVVFKVVMGFVVDKVIYGGDEGKLLIINSAHKSNEIIDYITNDLKKGVTVINSSGGYSKKEINSLLCAVSNRTFITLRVAIKEIDPDAFVIITNTTEVLGLGFKSQ